jgi:hypothetical protein
MVICGITIIIPPPLPTLLTLTALQDVPKPNSAEPEAGISVNLGHPQGRDLKSTLNFLGRIPCLSLIGIDL